MRWVVLLSGLLGCADGLRANGRGEYEVDEGYAIVVTSEAGGGRCDLWSVLDYPDLGEDDRPGFCVAQVAVEGPEPRQILYRDATNALLEPYQDGAVTLTFAGSAQLPTTNLKLHGTARPGLYPVELAWGDPADEGTWRTELLAVRAVRYRP